HRLPIMMERQWRAQCAELAPNGPEAPASPVPAAPYNLMVPRSACPGCRAPIAAWHNVPVLSWLLLRGRCANCHTRISVRYPLIEALCGVLSVAVVWKFGVSWPGCGALLVTWCLIALTGIDLDHQLLPDSLTLPLLWGGLVAALGWNISTTTNLPVSPADAIIGAAAGYVSLWSVYHLFRLCTGKEGMGYGDFKLLAALGAWLGWRMLLPIVLCSAAVGAVVGITLILLGRRGRGVPIPFGPFLAAAGWLAMMWGPQWVSAYLGLYGQH
ncbi:MAG TPA: A24 family peptidase, partial [Steroidobacteraceae bacterium]|nr:A24 family peptidase [Steroidobacteraceae bacterium]